jgi:hypothetical protein
MDKRRRRARLRAVMSRPISGTGALVALFAASVVLSAGLYLDYYLSLRKAHRTQYQAQRLQAELIVANRNRAVIQSLAGESMEYGKRNADMERLLQSYAPLLQQLNLKPAAPARPGAR